MVNYFVGKWIYTSQTNKKAILSIGVVFNILILVYFKYAYFFTDAFNTTFNTQLEVFNHFAHWANGFAGEGTFVERILLPVGVSFFTFQSISYSVDIYRKEIPPVSNFFDYTFFVTFFPQLVAGPIERATHLLPQFYQKRTFDYSKAVDGMRQILWGLFKKIVIADNCAEYANMIFNNSENFSGSTLVSDAICS